MAFRSDRRAIRQRRRTRRLAPYIVSRPMSVADTVSSGLHFDAVQHWQRRYMRRGIKVGYQDKDTTIG